MPFDFPASPAIGDASNGYVYNGVGWAGGPIAGPVTEQFFDLAGVSSFEIAVPSWAKSAQIQQLSWLPAAGQTGLQVSLDGTTYLTGGTDYQYMGFIHNTGSVAFAGVPQQGFSEFVISPSAATYNASMPFVAEYVLELARPTTAQVFHIRGLGRSYDNAATQLGRQLEIQQFILTASSGSNLRIQKFRVKNSAGNFQAGSYVRVKWIGAAADIPQSNAVGEAPQDSVIYSRRNGLWVPPQSGEILGGASGQYTGYGSGTATPIVLITLNYTVKNAGSKIIAWGSMGASNAVVSNNYASVYFQPSAQLGYSVFTQPTAAVSLWALPVTAMHTHAQPVGTVLSYTLRGWATTGTVFFGGTSGGAQSGMFSNLILQEVMP